MDLGRVGPFAVTREIARAPGAVWLAVRDVDGAPRLLQVARCRRAESDDDRANRLGHERALAQKTALLISDSELNVHAHGGADGEHGERLLFWALPWVDAPFLAERFTAEVPTLLEVLRIGRALSERLVRRQACGQFDPLLSDQAIRIRQEGNGPEGNVEVVGVPLFVPTAWMAADMLPPRLAREEREDEVPRASGDLWRLGTVLSELLGLLDRSRVDVADKLTEGAADEMGRLVSNLRAEDPAVRQSAGAVLQEIDRITAIHHLELDHPPKGSTEPAVSVAETSVASEDGRSSFCRTGSPNAAEDRMSESRARPGPDETGPEEVTKRIHGLSRARESVEVVAADPEAVTRQSEPRTPVPTTETPGERAKTDPLAAAWSQPVLPSGQSPWSEVVGPIGTVRRSRSAFPGFSGEVPVVSSSSRSDRGPPPPEQPIEPYPSASAAYPAIDSGEIDAEIAAAISGFNARKVVSGVLALLVIFGLFALIARGKQGAAEGDDTVVASAANEVLLDSNPSGATVVGEADGLLLGKTPMSFLVPTGSQPVVFLVSRGREPLRITLPEKGALTMRLEAASEIDCSVEIVSTDRAELEGVEVEIGSGPVRRIRGAAVVRAKAGQSVRGARLVTCLGRAEDATQLLAFDPPWTPAAVRVTQPAGAAAYLNDDPIGAVPSVARTPNAFARVRVDDAEGGISERWIPTRNDTEVRMPAPQPRRLALLLGPDVSMPSSRGASERGHALQATEVLAAGTKHMLAGRIQKAETSFLECLEIDPSLAECHRNLGTIYRRANEEAEARKHFLRYLELAPAAPDAASVERMLSGN